MGIGGEGEIIPVRRRDAIRFASPGAGTRRPLRLAFRELAGEVGTGRADFLKRDGASALVEGRGVR
jgi:hypothetical protein